VNGLREAVSAFPKAPHHCQARVRSQTQAMKFSDGAEDADLYGLLGVDRTAPLAALKRARRFQAKRWHPDQNKQHNEATARMAAINHAYDVLSDSAAREAYDESLRSHAEQTSRSAREDSSAPTSEAAPDDTAARSRQPAPRRRADSLAAYFSAHGLLFVDKRTKGGALWVLGGSDLEPIMEALHEGGFAFEYAPQGGRATKHRPAWWTESTG